MPKGTDNPGVEELPGKKTSSVTLERNGVLGIDERGRGDGGNSSAIQDTKGNTEASRREEMASGQEPVAPPSTPWGTAEGGRGGSTHVST